MYFFSIKLFRSHNMLQHLDSPSNIQIVLPTFRQSLTGHILMIFNIVRMYVLQNRQIAIVQTLINSLNLEGSSENKRILLHRITCHINLPKFPQYIKMKGLFLSFQLMGKFRFSRFPPIKFFIRVLAYFQLFCPKFCQLSFLTNEGRFRSKRLVFMLIMNDKILQQKTLKFAQTVIFFEKRLMKKLFSV